MKKGFTLIELIVVIAIMAIISAILFAGKQREEKRWALQFSAFELAQNFREMQEMAMGAGEVECGGVYTYSFGINFSETETYLLYADCNDNNVKDENDVFLRTVKFRKGVKVCSLSANPLDIVFIPPEPTSFVNNDPIDQEGIITLCLKDDETETKIVKVNTVGKIEIE